MADVHDLGDLGIRYCDVKHVVSTQSQKHVIDSYFHRDLGAILVLNGEVQVVEKWAPLYHESLVHIPAAFLQSLRSVLVLGGGDLFAVNEILKYDSIERVLVVDFDPSVTAVCSKIYSHVGDLLCDPRLEIQNRDMFDACQHLNEHFDLVVNDAVDLFVEGGTVSYDLLSGLCAIEGISVELVYRHLFFGKNAQSIIGSISARHKSLISLVCVPEYPGVLHPLLIWGSSRHLSSELRTSVNECHQRWIHGDEGNPCRYFSPDHMAYYLYLPPYVREHCGLAT